MVEQSSPALPPAEESKEAKPDTALEPKPASEPAPKPPNEPGFVCAREEWIREACKGLPFYKEHESQRYCVLHYPGEDKSAAFRKALQDKVDAKNFDFQGVWFPEAQFFKTRFSSDAHFDYATFSAPAHFHSAKFRGAAYFTGAVFEDSVNFRDAKFKMRAYFTQAVFHGLSDFTNATFKEQADFNPATLPVGYFRGAKFKALADFSGASFGEADFAAACFSNRADFRAAIISGRADFSRTEFTEAYFGGAAFCAEADFRSATFIGIANFSEAAFSDHVKFRGVEGKQVFNSVLNLQYARIDEPGDFSFDTLALRPRWFINVDPRKFNFTRVEWVGLLDRSYTVRDEINEATKIVPSPHNLLSIACWQLATNAEENHRFREASHLRHWSMSVQRLEMKMRDSFYWLHWLYWVLSGYGERILRAFLGLLSIVVLFTLFYTQVGFSQQPPTTENGAATSTVSEDKIGKPLELFRAFTYSLAVMSLQKPEPRPITGMAHGLVTLETILGPVQAALLALAIRRRFMVSG